MFCLSCTLTILVLSLSPTAFKGLMGRGEAEACGSRWTHRPRLRLPWPRPVPAGTGGGRGGGSCSHLGGVCVACDSLILAHRHCHLGCQSTESSMQVDPFLLPSNSNCLQAIALLLQTLETEGRQGKAFGNAHAFPSRAVAVLRNADG